MLLFWEFLQVHWKVVLPTPERIIVDLETWSPNSKPLLIERSRFESWPGSGRGVVFKKKVKAHFSSLGSNTAYHIKTSCFWYLIFNVYLTIRLWAQDFHWTIRLWAQDFYEVITNWAKGQIHYLKFSSPNHIKLFLYIVFNFILYTNCVD